MTKRLKLLADSYLDHIRIAVEAGDRGAPFRDFLDNWNAFQSEHDHHRTQSARPRWFNNPDARTRLAMLESLDFQSIGAAAIIKHAQCAPADYRVKHAARDKSVKLIVDHAIPLAVMINDLFAMEADLSRDGIRTYLTRWYRLGLLSHEENMRLDAAGLNSKMPGEWYVDVFARYSAAGIERA